MLLGVDTGGTFTDFVCFDESGLRYHKVLSTPDDPCRAIEQGINELGLDIAALHLVHGSTVATNAILERKGVPTLFITHRGLEDLLLIGRQTRAELYDLCPEPPRPWLQRQDCFGVSGRVDAEGVVLEDIEPAHLARLPACAKGYESVAVCTLFSFLNPDHERQIAQALPTGLFVSLSHEVLAEFREYERAAATFLNAYIGPIVQRYLNRLSRSVGVKHLFVMHSAGGVMSAELAGRQAVRLVLSGPAGGLVAARSIGRQLDRENLLTFDMGGTSTDVALLQGDPGITTESSIGHIPVALPMLDIHTIGAGGGSLAWIDEAGLPQVGPESAGAAPGPVCYGLGGKIPTVTDANLLLGRIPSDARLAGSMPLNREAAHAAFACYGEKLGLTAEQAAEAVVQIAEEHMAGALRVVSIQRGFDPADFSLLCFGGAGGLHACVVADKLGIQQVIVPVASGSFSALGMLAGRQLSEFSCSRCLGLSEAETPQLLDSLFHELELEAAEQMQGLKLTFQRRVDMRYAGQGFHLNVETAEGESVGELQQRFEDAHLQAYGHLLERPVEVVTARLTAFVDRSALVLPELPAASDKPEVSGMSEIYGVGPVPQLRRADLGPRHSWQGPALIVEDTATVWLPRQWRLNVSGNGHLLLERIHG